MSRFDFILKHVLGARMEKADGLSRRPDYYGTLFFLNQQFIMQGAMAGCDNYLVATVH